MSNYGDALKYTMQTVSDSIGPFAWVLSPVALIVALGVMSDATHKKILEAGESIEIKENKLESLQNQYDETINNKIDEINKQIEDLQIEGVKPSQEAITQLIKEAQTNKYAKQVLDQYLQKINNDSAQYNVQAKDRAEWARGSQLEWYQTNTTQPIESVNPNDINKPTEINPGITITPNPDNTIDIPTQSITGQGTVKPPAIEIPGNNIVDIPGDTTVDIPGDTTVDIPGDTTVDIPGDTTKENEKEENYDEEQYMPNIKDETEENIEQQVARTWTLDDIINYYEQAQQKQWEREDKIRQEGYDREDTAYQRAIADIRAAGGNPNLINVQPADTGTGITNATGLDSSAITKRMETTSNELIKILDREFQGDENTKKEVIGIINELISAAAMMIAFKKK